MSPEPRERLGIAERRERRRVLNRQYVRAWRERNPERNREQNREYYRKRAPELKIAAALRAAQPGPEESATRCGFGCHRPATQTVERLDLGTWQVKTVPYCGFC